jgi:hypothetical protein
VIDLEKYKKSLGSMADKMSESEILELRDLQDKEAEIFFNLWLEDVEKQKTTAQKV